MNKALRVFTFDSEQTSIDEKKSTFIEHKIRVLVGLVSFDILFDRDTPSELHIGQLGSALLNIRVDFEGLVDCLRDLAAEEVEHADFAVFGKSGH